ncbi:SpoVT/AbrB-like protein [Burkholderia lata]|uniref:SpoVT/AbrB-like protein n=2 Tax=Burkholderia lata (strain ATCC 17760 / DSM 23089 / LMG 22485 / NCIMB 9086 / R18194 / 383) TaxID=482957 RepID=Q39KU5_BURL3|nr:SpoVT/AbrB-like protein [Burkholderia lata]
MYTHGFTSSTRRIYCTSTVHPDVEGDMHTTRVFRNGNSQAVRIPADLAYERSDIELEIERIGDEIRIRPARRPLTNVLDKFAKFGPDFMAEGRGDHEQAEREGL